MATALSFSATCSTALRHSRPSRVLSRRRFLPTASLETAGVQDLLQRDRKSADLSVDSEFFERPEPAAAGDLKVSAQQQEEEGAGQQPTTSDGGGGSAVPRRSREAIDAGLELFQRGDFQGALEVFQLALELPGSGVERAEGRPREFACASTGEENATLYNMACCYARLGAVPSALTCLEAVLDNGFDDYQTIKGDPDLTAVRGPELDRLLAKYDGPTSLFGRLFRK